MYPILFLLNSYVAKKYSYLVVVVCVPYILITSMKNFTNYLALSCKIVETFWYGLLALLSKISVQLSPNYEVNFVINYYKKPS